MSKGEELFDRYLKIELGQQEAESDDERKYAKYVIGITSGAIGWIMYPKEDIIAKLDEAIAAGKYIGQRSVPDHLDDYDLVLVDSLDELDDMM